MVLPSPWLYYTLPCICIPSFAISRSASVALWCSSESTSFLTDALLLDSRVMNSDYDFSICGLCQHLVGPPPSPILVRSLGNSPSSTHSWVTPGRSIVLGQSVA
ncbi:hypothetical protein GW17_00046815 [Ensete ventricosum]|nr:hypothetical protein GW17_00046815 [Ensete ventricosum]RZR80190.1 hypothetical protein BHM03_00006137 [Ensete ventricosum]